MVTREKARTEMAFEILGYLSENPQAQDTLEGILEWWVLEREIRRSRLQVQQAMEDLVAQGLVEQRRSSDGRTRYRLRSRE